MTTQYEVNFDQDFCSNCANEIAASLEKLGITGVVVAPVAKLASKRVRCGRCTKTEFGEDAA